MSKLATVFTAGIVSPVTDIADMLHEHGFTVYIRPENCLIIVTDIRDEDVSKFKLLMYKFVRRLIVHEYDSMLEFMLQYNASIIVKHKKQNYIKHSVYKSPQTRPDGHDIIWFKPAKGHTFDLYDIVYDLGFLAPYINYYNWLGIKGKFIKTIPELVEQIQSQADFKVELKGMRPFTQLRKVMRYDDISHFLGYKINADENYNERNRKLHPNNGFVKQILNGY